MHKRQQCLNWFLVQAIQIFDIDTHPQRQSNHVDFSDFFPTQF